MNFRKYTSIENSYNKDFIDAIIENGLENETFVVQEKAHGSNLSIWTNDGMDFITAKRTAFLESDDKFYNHQMVLESILSKLIEVWKRLSENKDLEQMTIFGEIIGGIYPHPEVAKNKDAITVQKGVFYSPNNEFYAFDILINNAFYLPIKESNKLFEAAGFLYAKTLLEGDLKAVLNHYNIFQTTIPKQFGYPEIEGNTCEGIIIKTLNNLNFKSGKRVILKNKNEKWAEREKPKKTFEKPKIGNHIKILITEIGNYVTENRLNNVISKIGEVTQKDFGMLMALFSKDVVTDFTKDFDKDLLKLETKELKLITKSITPKMMKILNEYLK